jgi:peptide-methionine (R)-S-oxide reductase
MSTPDPALDPAVDPRTLTPADWRALLQPIEYAILRESATERPETGRYNEDPGAGAFHCAGCGQRLYGAEHKFHSGCGWPSFVQEVEPGALEIHRDTSHGMVRTEMRCNRCGGHLGHIFPDGPRSRGGMRHCVNGFAILYVPAGTSVADAFRAHRAQRGG